MKNIITGLLFIISINASAQTTDCKLWLNDPSDSIKGIEQLAEQYLQTDLIVSGNTEVKTIYELKDKEDLAFVKIWLKPKKAVVGGSSVTIYTISSVRISGLTERMESLITALKEKVAKCTTETTNTSFAFGNSKIVVENQGGGWPKKDIPHLSLTLTAK